MVRSTVGDIDMENDGWVSARTKNVGEEREMAKNHLSIMFQYGIVA